MTPHIQEAIFTKRDLEIPVDPIVKSFRQICVDFGITKQMLEKGVAQACDMYNIEEDAIHCRCMRLKGADSYGKHCAKCGTKVTFGGVSILVNNLILSARRANVSHRKMSEVLNLIGQKIIFHLEVVPQAT
jgi:hypothetical protein